MTPELITWLIPVPPILSFFLIVLFTNRSKALSHWVALVAIAISFVLAQAIFWPAVLAGGASLAEHPIQSSIPWLPVGLNVNEWIHMGVVVDPLTALMLFMVPLVSLMIFIYSVGYHRYGLPEPPPQTQGEVIDPPGHVERWYSRFFAFMSLFAGAMLLLVVADNILMLFVGWEIMGLCSYLLIGFWFRKKTAYTAAVKAFLTTRIADVFMLLGIANFFVTAGTLNFREVFENGNLLTQLAHTPSVIPGIPAASLTFLLLFIGTVGKSAQFPLHTWLPDAMEGPTPVSAVIHAAAMVSAGVYMVIRVFPLLAGTVNIGEATAEAPMFIPMAAIGAFTALFAATIAVSQNDIKRVLAFSTISQLAFMTAALGIGAYVAAAFHLLMHAFFKALLFLGSGSVIHGMEHGEHHVLHHPQTTAYSPVQELHAPALEGKGKEHGYPAYAYAFDPQDMMNMGGLRHRMPITFWTFLIGGMALSGLPLITAGFWSKDEILADAWHGLTLGNVMSFLVFIVLAVSAFLTAFYTMRQIGLTFLGQPRTREAEHASESVWTMTIPLMVLAFFSLFAGFVGIPKGFLGIQGDFNWFHNFVGPTVEKVIPLAPIPWSPVPFLTSVVVSLGGLGLGYLVYVRRPVRAGEPDPLVAFLGSFHGVLQHRYYLDELYQVLFIAPATWLSTVVVARVIDLTIIDGVLDTIARTAATMATAYRAFDLYVVSATGDAIAESIKGFGRGFREIQSGKVQEYLMLSVLIVAVLILVVMMLGGTGASAARFFIGQ